MQPDPQPRPECEVYVHDGTERAATLDRTAWYFQNAIGIMGPYGAAMNDMLFAKEGTPLLLFPVVPHVDFYYENLAAALGLAPLFHVSSLTSSQLGHFEVTELTLTEIGDILTTAIDSGE